MSAQLRKRILWITNQWDELAPHAIDTSLRLMQASFQLGHRTFWSTPCNVEILGGRVLISARRLVAVRPPRESEDFIFVESRLLMTTDDIDVIFYRVDPPVDDQYSQPLQILNCAANSQPDAFPQIINRPDVLLGMAGKTLSLVSRLPTPPSLITASKRSIYEFVTEHGRCVIKPIWRMQGRGVMAISKSDVKQRLGLEDGDFLLLPVVVQQFVDSQGGGEIRFWIANGELMGAAQRLPSAIQKHSHNVTDATLLPIPMRVAPWHLSKAERDSADDIGRTLLRCGVVMSAVDLIGGLVVDVNIVSPGLVVEMEAHDPGLAERIVARLVS